MTADSSAQSPKGRVLVVDDDEILLRVLARVLEGAGYEVLRCMDSREALKLLAATPVDLVLSDISMPGLSGIELLRKVRETHLDLPVVLSTGSPEVESAVQAVEYGAHKYLIKPVDPNTLLSTVAHALQLSRLAAMRREAVQLAGGESALAVDRAALEAGLTRAIDRLWMAFQPIVNARTRATYGFEALLRTEDSTFPHPGVFIETAERLHRVWELGRAVRNAVAIQAAAKPDAAFFVNLHPSDLRDPELLEPSTPLAKIAKRVVLEITERASIEDLEGLPTTIARLRELGFRVAVDDLGAGYAGLSSFAQLEPEVVKLDMSLIRNLDTSPVRQKLVGSMAQLCKDMGHLVVAEGVETAAERDVLIELGCDLLQGYWFGRPGKAFPVATWGD
jgi:EAL domain-containing protein (putative c-di-GMP-specific phosphodiesterase class I)/CheY-like chemotaxis protein